MTATVGPFDLSESVEFDSTIHPHPSQCTIVSMQEKQEEEEKKWKKKKKVLFLGFYLLF